MGLIEKIAAKAVLKVAEDIVLTGTLKHMDKNHSINGILKKSEMNQKLFVKRKFKIFERQFYVFDENKSKKYKIAWDRGSSKKIIKIYNNDEQEIGKAVSKKNSNTGLDDYYVYLNDVQLGKITQAMSLKIKLELTFNGWKVQGNLLQYDFNVFDDKNNLEMKIHQAYDSETYIIEYSNQESEMIGMLILMVIELIRE